MQFHLTIEVAFRLGQRGARLRGLEAQLTIVENREHLAGFYVIAFFDEDSQHLATHLGDDLGVGFGVEGGGTAVHGQHFAANWLGNFHGDRSIGGCLGVLAIRALVSGDTVFGTGGNRECERQYGCAKEVVCHVRPLCLRYDDANAQLVATGDGF